MKIIASRDSMTRADWLAVRKRGVFSTDASAILGLNPYKNALDVYADKVTDHETEENFYMKDGRDLEPFLAKRFEEEEGVASEPFPHVVLHDKHAWLGANLDYMVKSEALGTVGLELKTCGDRAWGRWQNGIPPEYHVQVMIQLAVTGFAGSYIFCWSYGKGTKCYYIERDESVFEAIFEPLSEFWHECVLKRIPPANISPTEEFFKQLYPRSIPTVVHLEADAIPHIESFNAAKERARAEELAMEVAKAKLLPLMGENAVGLCGEYKINWPSYESTRVDTKTLKAKHPEIYRACAVKSSYRKFTITKGE